MDFQLAASPFSPICSQINTIKLNTLIGNALVQTDIHYTKKPSPKYETQKTNTLNADFFFLLIYQPFGLVLNGDFLKMVLLTYFWDYVLLCSSGYLGTHYEAESILERPTIFIPSREAGIIGMSYPSQLPSFQLMASRDSVEEDDVVWTISGGLISCLEVENTTFVKYHSP